MPRLHVIGVGVGDPRHVTVEAIDAIGDTDVFFVVDKGAAKSDLMGARQAILDAFVDPDDYRIVTISDPERDRGEMSAEQYAQVVEQWRDDRMELIEKAIAAELSEGETGAFLVWGDPGLYDGTLRMLDDLVARGMTDLEYDVIPGISSLHALTARHRTLLNRVGGAVLITTGRRLANGWPADADDMLVMLDSGFAAKTFVGQDIGRQVTVYWGAYLGTCDELLIAGRLEEVAEQIETVRGRARERKGWIMDTYLLRRS